VAIDTLGTSRSVRLSPVSTSDTVLYIGVPNTDEYFLLENRQAIGSDSAQINDACVFGTRSCAKGPGLLVWHIDQGIVDARGFRLGNRVNTGPIQGVALVQADGLNQLREPGGKNRGDPGDPFPGSTNNRTLGDLTFPASVDNQGATAGFMLDSIYQDVDGSVAFRYTKTTAGLVNVSLLRPLMRFSGREASVRCNWPTSTPWGTRMAGTTWEISWRISRPTQRLCRLRCCGRCLRQIVGGLDEARHGCAGARGDSRLP
jgi:hypothetical protein